MKLSNKIIITVISILFSNFVLQSQTIAFADGLNKTTKENRKPQLSVSLSSSFTSFYPGYTSFGTTIMPKLTLPVSDKFKLSAGIGYSTFFMGSGETMFNSSPSSYGHIFVSGTYEVNEKISLRGTGYKTFSLNPTTSFNTETNTTNYDYSSQGVILDVEYRVNDNFKINVGFEYRQQNSPMYNPNGFQNNTQYTNPITPFNEFNSRSNLVPF